ncbi:hypothetical protein WP50_11100, partial [Lactiplantibacillus plantarum]
IVRRHRQVDKRHHQQQVWTVHVQRQRRFQVHVWSLKQDFVVGATDAVNVTSPTTWGWLIGIVLLVLLLIALIIFWVIKRRQNKR